MLEILYTVWLSLRVLFKRRHFNRLKNLCQVFEHDEVQVYDLMVCRRCGHTRDSFGNEGSGHQLPGYLVILNRELKKNNPKMYSEVAEREGFDIARLKPIPNLSDLILEDIWPGTFRGFLKQHFTLDAFIRKIKPIPGYKHNLLRYLCLAGFIFCSFNVITYLLNPLWWKVLIFLPINAFLGVMNYAFIDTHDATAEKEAWNKLLNPRR